MTSDRQVGVLASPQIEFHRLEFELYFVYVFRKA
jgi:hypothetical protein